MCKCHGKAEPGINSVAVCLSGKHNIEGYISPINCTHLQMGVKSGSGIIQLFLVSSSFFNYQIAVCFEPAFILFCVKITCQEC